MSPSNPWFVGPADLLSLRTLRSLDLSQCLHISGAEMAKGLKGSGGAGAPLESLNLSSCIYIRVGTGPWTFPRVCGALTSLLFLLPLQDSAVFAFAQLLGDSLRELDLTSCANLTDPSVCCIATHLRKLVILRLARCKEITDRGLLGMAEATKNNTDQEMVRLRGGLSEFTSVQVYL